ncbi:MAG TPA: HAMP domain-containing sensor histidine kinase [Trichocoleus sp.]|jgi:signal transduction histidine kinase
MLTPASSEFVALCRSQIRLLTDGLGAALSIVYLTEELTELADTQLIPIAAYPDAVVQWGEERILTLLFQGRREETGRWLLPELSGDSRATPVSADETTLLPWQAAERALTRQQQVVLPLVHENMVMGLLVTARADRAWNDSERQQIEQIAHTLAIGCVLDQRSQWITQDLRQMRQMREQKQDVFDTLLHQFRNPLTALRTFGKLLIKRLRPGDVNYSVAEGIVSESDRLQELLQQFDAALDWDSEAPLLNAASETAPPTFDIPGQVPHKPLALASSEANPDLLLPGASWVTGAMLEITPHPIEEVLDPLLTSAEAIAQDRQITLTTAIPKTLPPVLIDPKALREVLNNLIDNALKYTPAGGQVYIGVEAMPEQQAIVIADTGPGIPQQDLEHLFERHYRGAQATTGIPGTGLGLAIARDLIRQMQGEIQIISPARSSKMVPFQSDDLHPGTAVIVQLSLFQDQEMAANPE